VLFETGRLHPANTAYTAPEGEICICEGQGVKGDPGGQETPWEVHPYPTIVALIREGRLVEVKAREDTSALQMSPDDLRTLDVTPRAVKGLEAKGIEGVADLAAKAKISTDPVEWLGKTPGINGPQGARDLLEQLEKRGLYG